MINASKLVGQGRIGHRDARKCSDYADVINVHISRGLEKVKMNSGDAFSTQEIFLPNAVFADLYNRYLSPYSFSTSTISNLTHGSVFKTDEELETAVQNPELSQPMMWRKVKHVDVTNVWISDTRVLDEFLGKLWSVTSMAAEGDQPLGCGTVRILSGDSGSIMFKYDWFFQSLTISGKCSTYLQLRSWASLMVEPDYARLN